MAILHNSFSKCFGFFFFLKCLSQRKGECCSRRTKDFWKFHCNALFSTGSFFCQAQKNPSKLGMRQQLCLFLFGFFLFVSMTDRLGASLSKLSPSLHKLFSNPMEVLQGATCQKCPSASDTSMYSGTWRRR